MFLTYVIKSLSHKSTPTVKYEYMTEEFEM